MVGRTKGLMMFMTDTTPKRIALVLVCLAVTTACWVWIILGQRSGLKANLKQHQGLGQVMAEETIRLLGRNGSKRIVLVALDIADPALTAQLKAFQQTLKQCQNLKIEDRVLLKADEQHRSGPGVGLSAKRLAEIVKAHPGSDAIVSFAGVPNPEQAEMKGLDLKDKKFIAEARQSPERIKKLLERNVLDAVIVPRFTFPAPAPKKCKTSRQWFDKYFQVIERDHQSTE